MRKCYDEQLKQLNDELIQMGDLCIGAITFAISNMKTKKDEIKEKVVDIENEINLKEREIEHLCMKLLLEQQPVASDLRLVSSALKMISDMERIGDQAFDIAQMSPIEMDEGSILEKHIFNMAKSTIAMVSNSVDSFVQRDLKMAFSVMQDDDDVDLYFDKVKKDLLLVISQNTEKNGRILDLLMIAKYLERIGDHATNIAEWVVYSLTGEHQKLNQKKVN